MKIYFILVYMGGSIHTRKKFKEIKKPGIFAQQI